MFSPTHFAVLAGLAVLAFFICRGYLKLSADSRKIMRWTIAAIIVFLEISKDIELFATGQFTFANWPFELCGLGILIVAYDAILPGKTSHELLYSLTLPGAFAAEITPNWVTNNIVNAFVWQSFLIHCLLISYVLMQLIAKDFRPNWKALWRVVIFLAIAVPIDSLLNHFWGTNFMFLKTPVPGSPLEPVYLIFGKFYLLGMALLVAVVWFFMYLPWALAGRKADKS